METLTDSVRRRMSEPQQPLLDGIKRLARVGLDWRYAQKDAIAIAAQRDALIRYASQLGATRRDVAQAAAITPGRVQQILDQHPPAPQLPPPRALEPLADHAAADVHHIQTLLTPGHRPAVAALPAVAVAFAQRAIATAARGVEHPHRPIMLAGAYETLLEWPLLDVVSAAQIAHAELAPLLAEHDRQQFCPLDRARDALAAVPGHADGEVPQLRFLVRAVERHLYGAAKTFAFASAARLNDAYDAGLQLADASNGVLSAAGYALAAAARAPELQATRANGTWASHIDRYR